MQHDSVLRRRVVFSLLFVGVAISAWDKMIFSFSGVSIIRDFNLTHTQFGLAASAFFWLYSAAGIVVGLLANRCSSRSILFSMTGLWALSQVATALVPSFAGLVVSRIAIGAAMGPTTAMTQHAAFRWYPSDRRMVPSGLLHVGLYTGIISAALALPIFISAHGWRTAYLLLAMVSACWAIGWLVLGKDGYMGQPTVKPGAESAGKGGVGRYKPLLANRTFIGMTLIGFFSYLPSGLTLSWMPIYYQKALGFSAQQAGFFIMLGVVAVMVMTMPFTFVSQALVKKGIALRVAAVVLPVSASIIGGLLLLLMSLHGWSSGLKVVTLIVSGVCTNMIPSFGLVVCGSIASAHRRGALLAIHVALVTSAGFIAPLLASFFIGRAGGSIGLGIENTLMTIGCLTIVAGLVSLWLVDPDKTRRGLDALSDAPASAGLTPVA
jgi:MFS family permease